MAEIKCPNCENAIEFDENNAANGVTCQSCGASVQVTDINALLNDAFGLLSGGSFAEANQLFTKVAVANPENPYAYLGLLASEMGVTSKEAMRNFPYPFDTNPNYSKLMTYADDNLKSEIGGYLDAVKARCAKNEEIYQSAMSDLNRGTPDDVKNALEKLALIPGWRDADALAAKCREFLGLKPQKVKPQKAQKPAKVKKEKLPKEKKVKEKKEKKKSGGFKKFLIIFLVILILGGAAAAGFYFFLLPRLSYDKALALMNDGRFDEAIEVFDELDGYEQSEANIIECEYSIALGLMEEGYYEAAITKLEGLNGYKDSDALISEMSAENDYIAAVRLMEDGKYEEAVKAFTELDGYEDSAEKITECEYNIAVGFMEDGRYGDAREIFAKLGNYEESAYFADECLYNIALSDMEAGRFDEAITAFTELDGYEDSAQRITECKYGLANKALSKGEHSKAYTLLNEIKDYNNAAELLDSFAIIPTKVTSSYDTDGVYEFINDLDVEYGEDGRVTKVTGDYTDGSWYTYYFVYGEDGNVSAVEYEDYFSTLNSTSFEYDNDGNAVRIEQSADVLYGENFTVNYTYDENGNKVKETGVYAGDFGGYTIDYTYNRNNSLIREAYFADDSEEPLYITVYSYDRDGMLVTKNTSYTGSMTETTDYRYNENGQVVRETVTYISYADESSERTVYEYNYYYNEDGIRNIEISAADGYSAKIEYSDFVMLYFPNYSVIEYYVSF